MSYVLLDENQAIPDISWFDFEQISPAGDGSDQFIFRIEQDPVNTSVILKNFLLSISLQDYPESSAALVPVRASFRFCEPNQLRFISIEDQVVTAIRPSQTIEIPVVFNQEPCLFDVQFDAYSLSGAFR